MIDFLRPLLNWTEAIVIAVALYLFGPVTRRIVGALNVKRVWRERLMRALPALQILAWVAYGIWLVGLFVTDRVTSNVIAVAAVVGVAVLASWFAVRDLVSGAILRVEDTYQPGEWLKVGDKSGRIRRVGARSIELELEDGRRLRIPYGMLAGSAITKAEPVGSATAHSFSIEVPRTRSVAEVKADAQRAALLSMWSSTVRPPRVETSTITPDSVRLDVTVYALHPDYDLEVENAVRDALSTS